MIISASRRTDIPNYYADWFLRRIREGFLYVRNPVNPHQISEISLSPEVVDCIVFWTKNPAAMTERLDELREYAYYFQFTLTGYGREVEPGIPDKLRVMIPEFQALSDRIGKERVIWRYDPIFLSSRYTPQYHVQAFERIAGSLCGYTEKVVISFLDLYAKTQRNMADFDLRATAEKEILDLVEKLTRIAQKNRMEIESCAEQMDLQRVGVRHGSCIDRALIEQITGCRILGGKDKNQRQECGCLESIDIGAYDTCANGCKYCYANFSAKKSGEIIKQYRADSPLLCGTVGETDKITVRKMKTLRDPQLGFLV